MFRLSKQLMPPRQELSNLDALQESKEEQMKSPTPMSDENKTQDSRVESNNTGALSRDHVAPIAEQEQQSPPDKSGIEFQPQHLTTEKFLVKKSCCQYLKECSLFLFHKNSSFRKFVISFTLPPKIPKGINKQRGLVVNDDEADQEFFHSRKSSDSKTVFSADLYESQKETTPEKTAGFFSDNQDPASTDRKLNPRSPQPGSLFRFNKSEANISQNSQRKQHPRLAVLNEYKKLKRRNSIFEYLVLLLIIASSITIAIDNPLNNPNSRLSKILFVVDSIFTFLFLLEAILKIIATGFISSSIDRKPYMCNGWNILDFVVVVSSLVDFSLGVAGISTSTLKALKALRTIRALRPLRVISRNEGLKLVVNALISPIPPMINVLMVCLLFVFIFAILGTNFFKGTFFSCIDQNYQSASRAECPSQSWKNALAHFDTTLDAMLTLFEMLNLEGWTDVMWNGIDSTGTGLAPKRDNNLWYAFYFISFIIVGNMFLLNLFVGVVIDNFNQMKEKLGGYFWLTNEQKKWVEVQRLMIRMKLKFLVKPPENKCRKGAYLLVNSSSFEWFIVACIFFNSIVMALIHYRINPNFQTILESFNYFFAIVFNIECIAKLMGLGCSYFSSKWNIFDFIIVVGTNAGMIFSLAGSSINIGAAATGVRAFRIMRVIRLVNQSKHLRVILDTLVYILPSLANIGSMICLLIFIYSVLGMYIFAQVKYRPDGIGELRDYANFRSFGSAMLLLFRCATGESWNLLMHQLADSSQPCLSSQTYEERQRDGIQGCGSAFAYPFFVSFMVLISLMIMNLFVAVVIEGFEESRKDDEDSIINSRQLETFLEKWALYDPKAKGWIRPVDLAFLLHDIEMPLGYMCPSERISIHMSRKEKIKRMKRTMKKLKKQCKKELRSLTRQIGESRNKQEVKVLKGRFTERQLQLNRDVKGLKHTIKSLKNFKCAKARNRFEFENECDWTERSIHDIEGISDGIIEKKNTLAKVKSSFHRQKVAPFSEEDLHSFSREKHDHSPRLELPKPRDSLQVSLSEAKKIEQRPTSDRLPLNSFQAGKDSKQQSLNKTGKVFNHSRQSSQKSVSEQSYTYKPPAKDPRGRFKFSESMFVSNFGDQILQKGNLLINMNANVCVEKKRIKEILKELQLVVYWQKNGNYIHIRDVLLALTKRVASQKLGKESLQIDNYKMELKLNKEWTRKYPELARSRKNKQGDSERYWAAVIIQNAVRKWMHERRVFGVQKVVNRVKDEYVTPQTSEEHWNPKLEKKKTLFERTNTHQWKLKPNRLEPIDKKERHHSLQSNLSLNNTLLRSIEQSGMDSGKRASQEPRKEEVRSVQRNKEAPVLYISKFKQPQ